MYQLKFWKFVIEWTNKTLFEVLYIINNSDSLFSDDFDPDT